MSAVPGQVVWKKKRTANLLYLTVQYIKVHQSNFKLNQYDRKYKQDKLQSL